MNIKDFKKDKDGIGVLNSNQKGLDAARNRKRLIINQANKLVELEARIVELEKLINGG